MGLLHPGQLQKLLDQLALKGSCLVRMDTARKTVNEEEVMPETMSNLFGSLILAWEGVRHLGEMVSHN